MVNNCVAFNVRERNGDLISYDVWGATLLEVEVDVLTGDFKVCKPCREIRNGFLK